MNPFIASLYVGYALYAVFPFAAPIEAMGGTVTAKFFLDVFIYAVACSVSYALLKRFTGNGYYEWWRMAIIGLLALACLLALLYHTFGIAAAFHLPPILGTFFAPKAYFFWWFIAPLVGLLILAR
jgi:hypothetical protein